MAGFWFTWRKTPGLLGWPHYRAATLGDGIMLPTLTACLAGSVRSLTAYSQRTNSRVKVMAAGIGGVAIGVLLQLTWLLDSHPQLNWNLPEPHHFSVSGWYHAVFLIVMAGTISALVCLLVLRIRTVTSFQPDVLTELVSRKAAPSLILFSGWSFCALVAGDGGTGSSGLITVGLVLLLVAASAGIALAVVPLEARALLRRHMLFAAIGTASVVATAEDWRSRPLELSLILVTAVLLLAFASLIQGRTASEIAASVATATAAAALLLRGLDGTHDFVLSVLGAAAVALLAVGLRMVASRGSARECFRAEYPWIILLVFPATAYFEATRGRESITAALALVVIGIAFGRLVFPLCRKEFEGFQRFEVTLGVEVDATFSVGPNSSRSSAARKVYARMGLLSLAGFLIFFTFSLAAAPGVGFRQGKGWPNVTEPFYVCLAVVALTSIAAEAIRRRRCSRRVLFGARSAWCLLSLSVASTMLTLIGSSQVSPFVAVTAVQLILIYAWLSESGIGNTVMRQSPVPKGWLWLLSTVGCLPTVATFSFVATLGTRATHGPASLLSSVAPAAAALLVALLVAHVVSTLLVPWPELMRDNGVAQYTLRGSMLQDGGLISLMFVALVWVPAVGAEHIPAVSHDRLAGILTVVLSFLLFCGPIVMFCLRNNVDNARRFAAAAGRAPVATGWRGLLPCRAREAAQIYWRYLTCEPSKPADVAFSEVLDAHVAYQNAACLSLVVATLIGIAALANEYTAQRAGAAGASGSEAGLFEGG